MRRPRHLEDVSAVLIRKQEWADYLRLRRMPEKLCVKCERQYPNTRDFFAINANGRLRSTCTNCAAKAVHVRKKHACPFCQREEFLVTDTMSPDGMRLCRRCLRMLADMLNNTRDVYMRLARYIDRGHTKQSPPGC